MENIIVIMVFCLGCAIGLAGFSRVLNYLLEKFHNLTLAFLTGLITGSLMKIWPWKEIIETQVIRGKTHVIWGRPIMPDKFGGEFYFAVILMLLGFIAILIIERLAKREG
jgi:putative membrane protein